MRRIKNQDLEMFFVTIVFVLTLVLIVGISWYFDFIYIYIGLIAMALSILTYTLVNPLISYFRNHNILKDSDVTSKMFYYERKLAGYRFLSTYEDKVNKFLRRKRVVNNDFSLGNLDNGFPFASTKEPKLKFTVINHDEEISNLTQGEDTYNIIILKTQIQDRYLLLQNQAVNGIIYQDGPDISCILEVQILSVQDINKTNMTYRLFEKIFKKKTNILLFGNTVKICRLLGILASGI